MALNFLNFFYVQLGEVIVMVLIWLVIEILLTVLRVVEVKLFCIVLLALNCEGNG